MTQAEIFQYQMAIEEWKPGADVTMKDVVAHGIVDECVTMANKSIEDSIYKVLSLFY